jgi:hypothetical protein
VTFIGIDTGRDGAVAFLIDKENFVFPMPYKDRWVDVVMLSDIIRRTYVGNIYGVVEAIRMQRAGEGVTSFLINYGKILATLELLPVRYQEVFPITWKTSYGLMGKPKAESVRIAQLMYPDRTFVTPRKKLLDGQAEALLLADYARQLYRREHGF